MLQGPPQVLPQLSYQGGTPYERSQVLAALRASTFPWRILAGSPIRVNIANLPASDAQPGVVNIDSRLLDRPAGEFGWGVVQHEFGHEVDFGLLSEMARQHLLQVLHSSAWSGLPQHNANGAERFANMISSAYWPSPQNAMLPGPRDGYPSAQVFRAALVQALPQMTSPVSGLPGSPLRP